MKPKPTFERRVLRFLGYGFLAYVIFAFLLSPMWTVVTTKMLPTCLARF